MAPSRLDGNATTPTWYTTADIPDYTSPVPRNHHTNVCIVGAGISGLSVAWALTRQGVPVTVVDDGPVGGGETGRTSAHLSCALDDRYYHLEALFGEDGARLAAASHRAAIDAIESAVRQLAIDCDFRRVDGYLFAQPGGADELDRELAAATRAGVEVAMIDRAPLPFETGRCLRFPRQAEFQPIAYLRAIAAAIVGAGGRIHTGVRVNAIEGGESPHVQLEDGGVIHANAIVDASNASITSRYDLPLRQAAYRSYVIGLDVPAGAVEHGLYWDTADPYHYLRVTRGEGDREILLVGGEDHRTGHGDPTACWAPLERWARERFPVAGPVVTRWSGQVMEPADSLGYIGAARGRPGVFVVSGDSGNGLTNGVVASLLLPALIRGEDHPWAALYAPTRARSHGLGTLVQESVSSTASYADWLRGTDTASLRDVPAGEGRVLRYGAHRIAAFRDDHGTCHLRSARCPHLHAVVRWNPLERSWDCPAHGSRFDPCGRVVSSPSAHDLPVLDPEIEAGVRASDALALASSRSTLRAIQGAYYVASGLWPVLHIRSFEAVTGTRSPWAEKALGAAVTAIGAALLVGGGAGASPRTKGLGLGAALALGVSGAYLLRRHRFSVLGLVDTLLHASFAAGWLGSARTH